MKLAGSESAESVVRQAPSTYQVETTILQERLHRGLHERSRRPASLRVHQKRRLRPNHMTCGRRASCVVEQAVLLQIWSGDALRMRRRTFGNRVAHSAADSSPQEGWRRRSARTPASAARSLTCFACSTFTPRCSLVRSFVCCCCVLVVIAMASQTQGIQQLLQAEKRAAEKVRPNHAFILSHARGGLLLLTGDGE